MIIYLSALLAGLFPTRLVRPLMNLMGHRIAPGARIGFSLILVRRIHMGRQARIGHFNFVVLRRMVLRDGAYLGRMNIVHGPLSLWLEAKAGIGNTNKIVRGPAGPVTSGPAMLRLGRLSKITADHRIDCTESVHLGHYTTLAGVGSRLWTHGYVHDLEGPGRYRVDGSVHIGNNVYIGAGCTISAGVSIASGAMVGAGVTVARDLPEAALYVSAPLRTLPRPADPESRDNLIRLEDPRLCERVYLKKRR